MPRQILLAGGTRLWGRACLSLVNRVLFVTVEGCAGEKTQPKPPSNAHRLAYTCHCFTGCLLVRQRYSWTGYEAKLCFYRNKFRPRQSDFLCIRTHLMCQGYNAYRYKDMGHAGTFHFSSEDFAIIWLPHHKMSTKCLNPNGHFRTKQFSFSLSSSLAHTRKIFSQWWRNIVSECHG